MIMSERFLFFTGCKSGDYITTFCLYVHLVAGSVLKITKHLTNILVNFGWNGPPLWSSGQSFWLQIQRSRVRSPALPDFPSSMGLERGPLSLVSLVRSIEELLE